MAQEEAVRGRPWRGPLGIIVGNFYQANQLLINNGAGAYTSSTSFPGDISDTHILAFGDVDGDGDLDVIVGNENQANELLINNGAGAYTSSTSLPEDIEDPPSSGAYGWMTLGRRTDRP